MSLPIELVKEKMVELIKETAMGKDKMMASMSANIQRVAFNGLLERLGVDKKDFIPFEEPKF